MRITNSMITANTKANININKINADRLNTMTASGQKITRPSDDPVIAIRAMRLNTNLTELDQYKGKNIPDADAWFTDTETALSQTDVVLENIREKLNQASSEENVTSNVLDILEELQQLSDQFYALGNADSAGRTVFTGYRTGEMLTFMDADTIDYEIHEKVSFDKIEKMPYVAGTKDIDIAGTNLTTNFSTYNQEKVTEETSYRLRLSYDDLDKGSTFNVVIKDEKGNKLRDHTGPIESIAGMTQEQIDDLYLNVTMPTIIKETGELILPKTDYDTTLQKGAASVEIIYHKSEWQKGDPRPEHYFQCQTPVNDDDPRTYVEKPDGTRAPVEYNYNRIDPTTKEPVLFGGTVQGFIEQELTYEIAFNQSIQINSHANNTYIHDVGRDIDDLVSVTRALQATENKISTVEKALAEETDPARKPILENLLEAVKKENTLMKEKMHNMFTDAITKFKGYSDTINQEISKVGALTARLELTKNRVKDQQTNVKKLADENINADLTETALDYSNANLALEAAQMAAGKIAKQTLLNYI